MPKSNQSSAVFDYPKNLGFHALVFSNDDVVRLLRAAVKRERGQTAFAKHHSVNRAHLNMILNGKRPAGAIGLHKVYIDQKSAKD